ncbi:MAG: HAMP domain-containing sensor histidine kinase, partial [Candidatus Woesearchaeota archaeon]
LFNIILYDNMNRSLAVAGQPFPFISILLFTQVIYLKLVDKATLKDRLKKSEQLYAQEKEVSKMKDEFISTVSHELKTPLTSMKLYSSLLRDGKLGSVRPKQKDALRVVGEEIDRLNGLITDLLELSRLRSKKVKLELSEFDLHKLVNDKLYINMARKHKIKTIIDVPKKFFVVADRDKVKQVFINLFNNAIKFTEPKGTIRVVAKMHEKSWEFCIIDDGKGIEQDKIEKLFDQFYQVEDLMTRTKGGFGLGLSIVRGIVDLHKAKIEVKSKLGEGTAVCMLFPKLTMY